MNIINEFKKKEKEFEKDFSGICLSFIEENKNSFVGYYSVPYDIQDLPIVVLNKENGKMEIVYIPPEEGKVIYRNVEELE